MDKKRIISIIVIILILLLTVVIAVAFFFKPWDKTDQAVEINENLSQKTETPEVSLSADTDKDGLTREQEEIHGTDPVNPDTDGDGFKDGDEVANGYDPLKPAPGDKIGEVANQYSNQQYGIKISFPNELADYGYFEKITEASPFNSSLPFVHIASIEFGKNKDDFYDGERKDGGLFSIRIFDRSKCEGEVGSEEEKYFCSYHSLDDKSGIWKKWNTYEGDDRDPVSMDAFHSKFKYYWLGNNKYFFQFYFNNHSPLKTAHLSTDDSYQLKSEEKQKEFIDSLKIEILDIQ